MSTKPTGVSTHSITLYMLLGPAWFHMLYECVTISNPVTFSLPYESCITAHASRMIQNTLDKSVHNVCYYTEYIPITSAVGYVADLDLNSVRPSDSIWQHYKINVDSSSAKSSNNHLKAISQRYRDNSLENYF